MICINVKYRCASLRFPRAWLEPPPAGVFDLHGNQPLDKYNIQHYLLTQSQN